MLHPSTSQHGKRYFYIRDSDKIFKWKSSLDSEQHLVITESLKNPIKDDKNDDDGDKDDNDDDSSYENDHSLNDDDFVLVQVVIYHRNCQLRPT